MTLVFQYGSNCLDSEINNDKRLRGDAKFKGIAETVEDYEIAFDVWSKCRGCAASDIIRKPGNKVWGAIYEVPDYLLDRDGAKKRDRRSFDAIEGEGKNYTRKCIKVRRPDGTIDTALTYTVINPEAGLKTNFEYVRCIICGLRERQVPDEYVDRVKKIASSNNPDIAIEVKNL